MIRLVWRQHRGAALLVSVALVILATVVVVSGFSIDATYQHLGVERCLGSSPPATCGDIITAFKADTAFWRVFPIFLLFVPMLLAMLVGAPLIAREFEHGTYRLVWTQSVPRLRWLRWNLALIVGASLLVAAVVTALMTWWRIPFARVDGLLDPREFDLEGTVPLAYMGFAFALAISAGALLRKTILAMLLTVLGFVVVRFPILYLVRPHYVAPTVATWDPFLGPATARPAPGDWIFDGSWVDALGHSVSQSQVVSSCVTNSAHYTLQAGTAFTACTHAHHWLVTLVWQPASRFWLFQGIESAIFSALAIALLGLTMWWVQRHIR